jgi:hypothetical protein
MKEKKKPAAVSRKDLIADIAVDLDGYGRRIKLLELEVTSLYANEAGRDSSRAAAVFAFLLASLSGFIVGFALAWWIWARV